MGKINFHFVNNNDFNNGTKNEDHLYFVNKTTYVDLYKGSLPIVDPKVVKDGQNVSFGTIESSSTITATGNLIAPDAILGGRSIKAVATVQNDGLMSKDDKKFLEDVKDNHLLNGTIKIGDAILSYSDDALKITFI